MTPPLPFPSDERSTTVRDVLVVRAGTAERRPDLLAGEEPMAIRVAGPGQAPVDVAVTMRTPGCDGELAVGFLVSEGLLGPSDLVGLTVEVGDPAAVSTPENELVVRIARRFDAADVPARAFVASASFAASNARPSSVLSLASSTLRNTESTSANTGSSPPRNSSASM